jgi:predicted nucleic acid-binding protein
VAALCVAFSLDAGESQCLALLATIPDGMLLTDDAAARLVGERMGLRVHGTIGVLIRAIRRGTRTAREVLDILEELPRRSTLFIQRSLLQEVKERIRGTYSL